MIDGEIIRYDNKLSDRFLNASRGVDGTSPSTHDAGTFVRQYRENVTIVSVGMSGAGSTSDIISVGSIQTGSASVADIITTTQKIVNPNIVSIGDDITLVIQDIISTNSVIDVSGFITIFPPRVDVESVVIQSASVADIITTTQQITNPNIVSIGDEITINTNTAINSNSIVNISYLRGISSSIQQIIDLVSVTSINNSIVSSIQQTTNPNIASTTFAVERSYKTGIIDYYIENILLDGFVLTRLGTTIVLDSPIQTINLRGGATINVENTSIRYNTDFDSYTIGNVGNNISTIESWKFMDTGTVPNGGTSIEELELNYGSLSLNDFQQVKFTSYISTGVYYNGGYPSISESGAILNTNMTTTSTSLSVQTVNGSSTVLSKFPSSGYIRIGNEVISYTGKTTVSLTGITRSVNGVVETHSIGDYLRTTN